MEELRRVRRLIMFALLAWLVLVAGGALWFLR
jgi:hypothetical protein